jgi:hypothetical protein
MSLSTTLTSAFGNLIGSNTATTSTTLGTVTSTTPASPTITVTGATGATYTGAVSSITSGGYIVSGGGGSGVTWTNPGYGYGNLTTGGYNTISTTLKVAGDAEFEGELKIKGVNLTDRLDKIEERLGILRPNEGLEEKWDELKALGDRYRELEKDILEKEKIWDLLKR